MQQQQHKMSSDPEPVPYAMIDDHYSFLKDIPEWNEMTEDEPYYRQHDGDGGTIIYVRKIKPQFAEMLRKLPDTTRDIGGKYNLFVLERRIVTLCMNDKRYDIVDFFVRNSDANEATLYSTKDPATGEWVLGYHKQPWSKQDVLDGIRAMHRFLLRDESQYTCVVM